MSKMNTKKKLVFSGSLLVLLLMCLCILFTLDDESSPEEESQASSTKAYEVKKPAEALEKGNRIFGINISEGREGFGSAFAVAQQAGVEVIELNIPWNMIETAPETYVDPEGVFQAIAFYGEHDIQVFLSLAVINTVDRTTPAHLSDIPFDDPQVIGSFNNMVDWILRTVPDNVIIPGISIGNEVDLYLEGEDWNAYTQFYQATSEHIQDRYPDIEVGVKTTVMNGILKKHELKRVKGINQTSDVIMLNYYPLDDNFHVLPPDRVHDHFAQIVKTFPDKEIWFTEVGYPSGRSYCQSSEEKQAQFFQELFLAWDTHRSHVQLLIVNWLHDQSEKQIAEWETYYGSSAPGFVEYLSTLGLRNYDHTDKSAWFQVLAETRARGWSQK